MDKVFKKETSINLKEHTSRVKSKKENLDGILYQEILVDFNTNIKDLLMLMVNFMVKEN